MRIINLIMTIESRSIAWKARHGLTFLRISLGILFFWFGFLKFFPGLSSAEQIGGETILKLSFGHILPAVSMKILAVWECLIGIGLVTKKFLSFTLLLLYFQMVGTLTPLLLFPELTFENSLLVPTLLGQYIIKNFVLISAGVVIGATAKGGSIISNAAVAEKGKHMEDLISRYRRRFNQDPSVDKRKWN